MPTKELAFFDFKRPSMHLPKSIDCIECKKTFVFSTEEQDFFQSRGLANEPKRCPHCRILMRMRREGKPTSIVTQTNCVLCGKETTVPFLPRDEKKIFCAGCYKQQGFKREQRYAAPIHGYA